MEEKVVLTEISKPLYVSKGWIKFVGVMLIIQGILTALTVFGIIICWIPIWLGVLLFQSSGKIELAYKQGDKTNLIESLSKLKTYFTVTGVLYLITLIGTLVALIVTGGSIFSIFRSLS